MMNQLWREVISMLASTDGLSNGLALSPVSKDITYSFSATARKPEAGPALSAENFYNVNVTVSNKQGAVIAKPYYKSDAISVV